MNEKTEQTAAMVAEWRKKVEDTTTAIAHAEQVVATSDRRRSEFALEATLGDREAHMRLAQMR